MNILFLCVGNSARSQIAEGFAKNILPKNYKIFSAGSNPTGKVNKYAIEVMSDVGIDISNHSSKHIDELDKDFINNLNFVITLCAEEICPVMPAMTRTLHWPQVDPDNKSYTSEQSKAAFSKARDDIFSLLKKFYIEESF